MVKITTKKMKHLLNWMAAYFLLTEEDTEVLNAILSALEGPSAQTIQTLTNEMEQMFMQKSSRKDREYFIRHIQGRAAKEGEE